MALYEEYPQNIVTKDAIDDKLDQYFRTNTGLIKDDGDNPSGKKLVDPDLKPLFRYHFGTKWGDKEAGAGVGGQAAGWVVLPKGRVVAVDPAVQRKDWNMEKLMNVVTIANGGYDFDDDPDSEGDDALMKDDSDRDYRAPNRPAGVSTINVYENKDGRFTGNLPAYTTRANITLPLFASRAQAEEIEWGSAYCTNEITYDDPTEVTLDDVSAGLKPGDYVKADVYGRITKWDSANDDVEQIIGRVDRLSTEMIPQDFLKWVMPDGENMPELLLNKLGYDPEDIIDSDFFDPSYAQGYERNAYMPLGIPGLTDGMNITLTKSDIELLSVSGTEVGDTLQLRVPADEGKFVEGTVSLEDDNGWDLLSTYSEGAIASEGSTEVGDLGDLTITGGEDEDYDMTFTFTSSAGTEDTDESAAYDSGTNTVTIDLVDNGDYDANDIETYIAAISEATPTNVDSWGDYVVAQQVTGIEEDASTFVAADDLVTEGGQSEGPQRLEITHTDPENHLITVDVLDTQDTNDMTIFGSFDATNALPGIPTELDWDGVVGSVDIVINL